MLTTEIIYFCIWCYQILKLSNNRMGRTFICWSLHICLFTVFHVYSFEKCELATNTMPPLFVVPSFCTMDISRHASFCFIPKKASLEIGSLQHYFWWKKSNIARCYCNNYVLLHTVLKHLDRMSWIEYIWAAVYILFIRETNMK